MNHTHRTIYNHALGAYTAVAETAKAGGKGKRAAVSAPNPYPLARLTLALLIGLGGFGQQALAQTVNIDCQAVGTTAANRNGTQCGQGATAHKAGGTAFGKNAEAVQRSVAVGANATATGKNAVAIGSHTNLNQTTQATGKQSTAIGDDSRATQIQSVAIGSRARATGRQATALGNDSMAIGQGSVVIGGDDSTYFVGGTRTEASFEKADGTEYYYGQKNGGIEDTYTDPSTSSKPYRNALAGGLGSTAINVHAQALSEGSVAIGIGSLAGQFNQAAYIAKYGTGGTAPDASRFDGGNILAGEITAEDFNDFGYNDRATAIGAAARAVGEQSAAIGVLAHSEGKDSAAFGSNTHSVGERSAAIGYNSVAYNKSDIAIGDGAVAGTNANNGQFDNKAIAIGTGSKATGVQSISIGTGNIVTGNHSGAFGNPSIINGKNSYSIGNNNNIAAGVTTGTFVMGNDVNANVDNSVYLGNKTTVTAGNAVGTKNLTQAGVAGATTSAGDKGTVNSATVGGVTYGGFAGATADGAVSVGAAGNERRVQNVAAGEISATSTDAINGSQLYSVAKNLGDKLGGRINNVEKDAHAGTASAMALAGLPQAFSPGKKMVAVGGATYRGEQAIAASISTVSDNGKWVLKGMVSHSSRGHTGGTVGVGYQW